MTGPLSGFRVLTLEQFGAGPYGSLQLADLGAEVIKIENPAAGGDASRAMGPNFLGDNDSEYFQSMNYNKRSVTLNLKTDAGQQVLTRLVERSDALMNNLRGDQPEALGLTYERMKAFNPKIVCGHLSAYGRDNPRTARPGYDYLMQAEAGFLAVTGEPDTPPARFGLSIIDFMSGMTMAFALVAALLDAQRTGKGRDVDVSLFDVALSNLNYPGTWYLNSGTRTTRLPRSAHPSAVPVQLVKSKDGWVFLMCMMEKFWLRLVESIGRPELAKDPRFENNAARRENRDLLTPILDNIFQSRTTNEWIETLGSVIPIAPVNDIAQALDNPFVSEIGMIQSVDHPHNPDFRAISSPIKLDGQRSKEEPCAPLGSDTEEILRELGYDVGEIAKLRANQAI